MMAPSFRVATLAVAFISLFVAGAAHAAPREFRPGTVNGPEQLPVSRFRKRLEALPPHARARALAHLKNFHFTETDLPSLDADANGDVLYIDRFELGVVAEVEASEPSAAAAAVAVSPFPANLAFHSKPGSPNVIYLNFCGENVTGTAWNNTVGRAAIPALAFSTDADYATFSDAEQSAIKRIWERVAEDYSSFDVDVTTERPASFNARTAMALITRNTDANGAANPAFDAGGIAYISSFATGSYATYRPAWVYYNNLSAVESYVAEAVSHEIGHNLGLSHDGTATLDYYGGHGSGNTSWGPIMGTSYSRNVSQWSKGEYYLADNTQDDLATIAVKIPYRADDHGNTAATATPLVFTGTNLFSTTLESEPTNTNRANKGIIERNNDVDVFSFASGSGTVMLTINPWIQPSGTRGGNLDIIAELRDANGVVVATNNPANDTAAQIQASVSSGTYFLFVRNSGAGTPLSTSPSGYTSYGSIGQYFINGSVPAHVVATPVYQLAAAPNNHDWGSVNLTSTSAVAGSTIELIATPAAYFRFAGWTNGISSTANPLSLVLQTNLSVTAVFAELLTTNHPTPLWWLAANGVTANFEMAVDSLGANGLPLWQSYLAGVNPGSTVNPLRLLVRGNVLLWNPTPGRTYTLLSSTNVFGTFSPVPGAINLPSTIASFTNTAGSAEAMRFYRLQVSLP